MKPTPTKILTAMREYYALNGVLPAYSRIMQLTGIKSKNTVYLGMQILIEDGYIAMTFDRQAKPGGLFLPRLAAK